MPGGFVVAVGGMAAAVPGVPDLQPEAPLRRAASQYPVASFALSESHCVSTTAWFDRRAFVTYGFLGVGVRASGSRAFALATADPTEDLSGGQPPLVPLHPR